jgi:2-isopropylmalate synthase
MGKVTVELEIGNRRVIGRGASTDIIEASAKAYVDALNRLGSFSKIDQRGASRR